MKNLLACLLAVIAGTFGISFIDNEARELININSQKIEEVYSQYLDLKEGYEELSSLYEIENNKEYKIGDKINIEVISHDGNNVIDTDLECYGIITGINPYYLDYYIVDIIVNGTISIKESENLPIKIYLYVKEGTRDMPAGSFVIDNPNGIYSFRPHGL